MVARLRPKDWDISVTNVPSLKRTRISFPEVFSQENVLGVRKMALFVLVEVVFFHSGKRRVVWYVFPGPCSG